MVTQTNPSDLDDQVKKAMMGVLKDFSPEGMTVREILTKTAGTLGQNQDAVKGAIDEALKMLEKNGINPDDVIGVGPNAP